MLGISEALALGQSLGMSASTLTKVFNSSSARCWSRYWVEMQSSRCKVVTWLVVPYWLWLHVKLINCDLLVMVVIVTIQFQGWWMECHLPGIMKVDLQLSLWLVLICSIFCKVYSSLCLGHSLKAQFLLLHALNLKSYCVELNHPQVKDLGLASLSAKEVGFRCPLTSQAQEM